MICYLVKECDKQHDRINSNHYPLCLCQRSTNGNSSCCATCAFYLRFYGLGGVAFGHNKKLVKQHSVVFCFCYNWLWFGLILKRAGFGLSLCCFASNTQMCF